MWTTILLNRESFYSWVNEQMVEVDWFANITPHFNQLLLVKNVFKTFKHLLLVVSCEFNRRECELRLLHVVVYLLIEIATHVCFKYDREMIPVPCSTMASLWVNTRLLARWTIKINLHLIARSSCQSNQEAMYRHSASERDVVYLQWPSSNVDTSLLTIHCL